MNEPDVDEVRERHPEWTIREVFGGWLAVRGDDIEIVAAMFLGSLEEKMREADKS